MIELPYTDASYSIVLLGYEQFYTVLKSMTWPSSVVTHVSCDVFQIDIDITGERHIS